jgi:multidrug transporter EmrE-like cation transporter
MVNLNQAVIVILAGIVVAIADGMIKKTAIGSSFTDALKNPLMIGVVFLYLLQIAFFTYVFVNGWQLGVVGVLQMVAYSAFVILTGILVFKESFTVTQYLGFVLAVGGVILINL